MDAAGHDDETSQECRQLSDVTISRRQLAESELPIYPGVGLDRISLVFDASLAARALAALQAAPAIGFDTESKPTFLKGEISTGPHLVQLATDEHVYLFPVAFAANHDVLRQILAAPHLLKIGFGLGNDRSALRSRLGIELTNVLDLGEVLRGPGHRGTVGAKVAVAHYFGQKLQKSKKVGTSNWASTRLNDRQLLYAANDAHVALQIYRAWLRDPEQKAPVNDQQ
ncbi:MAG: 3'-5' exonuclease domain-containing protein 2 [Gammaproteobacteria bacterium]|nr:3'-5' exonuclease domain-containing protein 2 [Gammaproteobacteria bacterium]MBU2435917.1 3'-5' exonuclease domain-containing protein 2 [Gammaproteobacteria bacterium]MBU2449302.1 3'-5' exonuclease domain-containing protein 2 [Gammaproteobacteria bacterium]